MPKQSIYLTFDNTVEALKYYEQEMKAKIVVRKSVTPEMNEHFKLPEENLEDSTFFAEFEVEGNRFTCSDKLDGNAPFNDSFNIIMDYTASELDRFNKYCDVLRQATGKIIYDNTDSVDDMIMFRFVDKYGMIWSFILNK